MGSTSIPEWSSLRIAGKWRWIHMFCSLGWTFSQLPLQKKPTRKNKIKNALLLSTNTSCAPP
jgi:hypothetical protein